MPLQRCFYTYRLRQDWPQVSEVMAAHQEWLAGMVVLLLLLTAYGVMNVTVAIFVNSAMDASSVRSRDIAKKAKAGQLAHFQVNSGLSRHLKGFE